MTPKKKNSDCNSRKFTPECCTIAAIVTIDGKGQILLPKDIRSQMGIKTGDKLALVSMPGEKSTCCLMLMKANELNSLVKIKVDSVLGEKET